MFYDILDQIMEFKTFLISTRRCRLAPLLLFYFNDSLFSETRIDKFGSLNIKKQTYLGLSYGLGQKIIFQAKSYNKTFFYLRTNVTLTSSCCWRGDRECRFLRTMRYVTYTHFVWDLFCFAKTIYKKIDSNEIHIRLTNPDVSVFYNNLYRVPHPNPDSHSTMSVRIRVWYPVYVMPDPYPLSRLFKEP